MSTPLARTPKIKASVQAKLPSRCRSLSSLVAQYLQTNPLPEHPTGFFARRRAKVPSNEEKLIALANALNENSGTYAKLLKEIEPLLPTVTEDSHAQPLVKALYQHLVEAYARGIGVRFDLQHAQQLAERAGLRDATSFQLSPAQEQLYAYTCLSPDLWTNYKKQHPIRSRMLLELLEARELRQLIDQKPQQNRSHKEIRQLVTSQISGQLPTENLQELTDLAYLYATRYNTPGQIIRHKIVARFLLERGEEVANVALRRAASLGDLESHDLLIHSCLEGWFAPLPNSRQREELHTLIEKMVYLNPNDPVAKRWSAMRHPRQLAREVERLREEKRRNPNHFREESQLTFSLLALAECHLTGFETKRDVGKAVELLYSAGENTACRKKLAELAIRGIGGLELTAFRPEIDREEELQRLHAIRYGNDEEKKATTTAFQKELYNPIKGATARRECALYELSNASCPSNPLRKRLQGLALAGHNDAARTLGLQYFRERKFPEAKRFLRRVIRSDPTDMAARCGLARLLLLDTSDLCDRILNLGKTIKYALRGLFAARYRVLRNVYTLLDNPNHKEAQRLLLLGDETIPHPCFRCSREEYYNRLLAFRKLATDDASLVRKIDEKLKELSPAGVYFDTPDSFQIQIEGTDYSLARLQNSLPVLLNAQPADLITARNRLEYARWLYQAAPRQAPPLREDTLAALLTIRRNLFLRYRNPLEWVQKQLELAIVSGDGPCIADAIEKLHHLLSDQLKTAAVQVYLLGEELKKTLSPDRHRQIRTRLVELASQSPNLRAQILFHLATSLKASSAETRSEKRALADILKTFLETEQAHTAFQLMADTLIDSSDKNLLRPMAMIPEDLWKRHFLKDQVKSVTLLQKIAKQCPDQCQHINELIGVLTLTLIEPELKAQQLQELSDHVNLSEIPQVHERLLAHFSELPLGVALHIFLRSALFTVAEGPQFWSKIQEQLTCGLFDLETLKILLHDHASQLARSENSTAMWVDLYLFADKSPITQAWQLLDAIRPLFGRATTFDELALVTPFFEKTMQFCQEKIASEQLDEVYLLLQKVAVYIAESDIRERLSEELLMLLEKLHLECNASEEIGGALVKATGSVWQIDQRFEERVNRLAYTRDTPPPE